MEFEPLLNAGIHDITKDDLSNHFVTPFENKDKRLKLIERFNYLIEKVEEIGIPFEVWINGSFVTNKEEPNDIDVAFFFDPAVANALPEDKKIIFREVANNSVSKYRYNCDVYFLPNNDVNLRSYWRGWFGFTRTEKAKGFARITI
jgi:hypothetical protein